MIVDLSNPIGIGPLWSVVAFPSTVVVVAGPYCVISMSVYNPGSGDKATFNPGSAKQAIHNPGTTSQHVCK